MGKSKQRSEQGREGGEMSRPSIKGTTTQKPNIRALRALPEPQQGGQRIPGAPVSTEPLLTLGPWSQMALTPQTPKKA